MTTFAGLVCKQSVVECTAHAKKPIELQAYMVDFEGKILGQHPRKGLAKYERHGDK